MRFSRPIFVIIQSCLLNLLVTNPLSAQDFGVLVEDFPDIGETMLVTDIEIIDGDEEIAEVEAVDCNGNKWLFIVDPEGVLFAFELGEEDRSTGISVLQKLNLGQFAEGLGDLEATCSTEGAEAYIAAREGNETNLLAFREAYNFKKETAKSNVFSTSVDSENGKVFALSSDNAGGFDVNECNQGSCQSLFGAQNSGVGSHPNGYIFDLLTSASAFYVLHEVNRGADTQKKVTCYNKQGQVAWSTVLTNDIQVSGSDFFLFSTGMVLNDQILGVVFYNRFRRCIEAWFLNTQNGQTTTNPVPISDDVVTNRYSDVNISSIRISGGRDVYVADHFSNSEISPFRLNRTAISVSNDTSTNQVSRQIASAYGQFALVNQPVHGELKPFQLSEEGQIEGHSRELHFISTNSIGVFSSSITPTPQNIPQFADGGGIFDSIVVTNLDPDNQVDVTLNFKDQDGNALKLDQNGDQITIPGNSINGQISFTIPAHGRRTLTTDGQGAVVVGTVVVSSSGPVNVNSIFSGPIGLAGVAGSPTFNSGFTAPIDSTSAESTGTGLAIMNKENKEVKVTLELYDSAGEKKATATLDIPANGQRALFVSQFDWDNSGINFNNFRGSIEAKADGKVSALAIQTRNGNQFATIPVKAL